MSRAKANAVAGGVGLLVAGGLLVVLGLVSGCATRPAAVYQKPGVAEAERERDENACLRGSVVSNDRGYVLLPFDIDRDAYHRCMQARGYVARPMQ
jgi:hypothetical protein